ncbi:MAG: hypothetical protein ACOYMZ_01025 [Minisyncoccia bacterium]
MESTAVQNNNYNPRVLEEHAVLSGYEQKKQRTAVAIICIVIVVGLAVWYFMEQKDKALSPEEALRSLSESSLPVNKTPEQVFAQGSVLGATSSPTKTTPSDRLQMLNSLNN